MIFFLIQLRSIGPLWLTWIKLAVISFDHVRLSWYSYSAYKGIANELPKRLGWATFSFLVVVRLAVQRLPYFSSCFLVRVFNPRVFSVPANISTWTVTMNNVDPSHFGTYFVRISTWWTEKLRRSIACYTHFHIIDRGQNFKNKNRLLFRLLHKNLTRSKTAIFSSQSAYRKTKTLSLTDCPCLSWLSFFLIPVGL